VECGTATHEAAPPAGTASDAWPTFVKVIIAKLPPRDDYALNSAVGVCDSTDHGVSVNGRPLKILRLAGLNMSLGANEENGRFVMDLTLVTGDLPTACTEIPAATDDDQILDCEDATQAGPMVVAGRFRGDLYVMAFYPDGRMISFEDRGSPFDLETMRALVTDPEVAALLG
jgi:hypothetical protein